MPQQLQLCCLGGARSHRLRKCAAGSLIIQIVSPIHGKVNKGPGPPGRDKHSSASVKIASPTTSNASVDCRDTSGKRALIEPRNDILTAEVAVSGLWSLNARFPNHRLWA